MGFSVAQTYLSDILHVVSQSLLAPDIILLLAFILYALFSIGSVIAEYFTERRHFQVVMPRFLAALMAAKEEDIPQVIENSGLLNRQKEALNTVYEYRALEGDALVALVRRLVNEEETRYDRITGRNNMAAKVSPMLGLMGTLIPLGPGIQALGTADTAALSASLLVAFDTTVAGLVTAAVCLVVGKIRSNWYNNYLSALDAGMATMMEKIEEGRATSTATLPEGADDYHFLFGVDESKKDEPKKGATVATEEDKPVAHELEERKTTLPFGAGSGVLSSGESAATASAVGAAAFASAAEPAVSAVAAETSEREEVATIAPEPAEETPAPVVVSESEPVVAAEPAPIAVEEPEPVAVEEPKPVAVEEPEPVVASEPEPVAVPEQTDAITVAMMSDPVEVTVPETAEPAAEKPAMKSPFGFNFDTLKSDSENTPSHDA